MKQTLFLAWALTQVAFSTPGPFPKSVQLDGKALILNGLGMREATIFAVDVYQAGLYLSQTSQDPEKILQSPEAKQIRMHFVRDVSKEELQEAWQKGFEKNCPESERGQFQPLLDQVKSEMKSVKVNDWMIFSFLKDAVRIKIADFPETTILARNFPPVLLSLWLGQSPPNSGLKEGLLGKRSSAQ